MAAHMPDTDRRIDNKVPISQSEDVVRAAREAGLDIVFDVRPDTDHLFDADPKCEMEEMYLWIEDLLARV